MLLEFATMNPQLGLGVRQGPGTSLRRRHLRCKLWTSNLFRLFLSDQLSHRSPTLAQSRRRDNPPRTRAKPVLPDTVPSLISSSEAVADPEQGADQAAEEADEEGTEEEADLPATGQGCYSFQMSLLQKRRKLSRSGVWPINRGWARDLRRRGA